MSWVSVGITGGSAILGGFLGGKKKNQGPTITQLPDYAESTGARQSWWDKLQQWGADPNYGAITPDWADIWQNAENKVRQYYRGSATTPGLIGRLKSNAARRGVSGSPSLDRSITRLGVEEGGQLKDMATQQGVARAEMAEGGRRTWLDSIMGLSSLKPQFNISAPQQQNNLGSMIAKVGGAIGGAYGQQQNYKWLQDILHPSTLSYAGTTGQSAGMPMAFGGQNWARNPWAF